MRPIAESASRAAGPNSPRKASSLRGCSPVHRNGRQVSKGAITGSSRFHSGKAWSKQPSLSRSTTAALQTGKFGQRARSQGSNTAIAFVALAPSLCGVSSHTRSKGTSPSGRPPPTTKIPGSPSIGACPAPGTRTRSLCRNKSSSRVGKRPRDEKFELSWRG
jgi:hypothetical protein